MLPLKRDHCVLTGQKDLEPLYSFKNFPIFMGCSDAPPEQDLKADMDWWISRGSGVIQLNPLIPLEDLYPESHGAGCVGALWAKHHKDFAAFVGKFKPSGVLEIGGAHGILAQNYHTTSNIPWTIIEPNPTPVDGSRARFIKGFFDDKFFFDGRFDAVIHSHVFEHIYEPNVFMGHLAGFMPAGTHLIFSLPNLKVMLERKYTNGINFEHTVFLTEPYIEFLLSKHGFRLVIKEYFMEDHSIFYAAVRDPTVQAMGLPEGIYDINRRLYENYIVYHEMLVRDLNQRLETISVPVYLFGAHVFAQYLLAFGLDSNRITALLDNDPQKQGRRLSGTHLKVQSPKILRDMPAAAVILKAGVYNKEIRDDILVNINPSVVFLE